MELVTPVLIIDDEADLNSKESFGEEEEEEEREEEVEEKEKSIEPSKVQISTEEVQDYLQAWNEVGGLAVAVGSKLIKRESVVIRDLCQRVEGRKQQRKRCYEEFQNNGGHQTDQDADHTERKSVVQKLFRMQRMAKLLFNLEQIHHSFQCEMQAIANEIDGSS